MKTQITAIVALFGLLLTGCQQETTNIDIRNDDGKPVMALDYRDFDQAASEMVQSMLQSGALSKQGGGRYVVATGRIVNDTMQRIDTDQLMAKIEEELLNSGKVVMTSAVGDKNAPLNSDRGRNEDMGAQDKMIYKIRDLKKSDASDEFDQKTMPAKGQIVLPELSISGKIIQKNIRYDNDRQQVEYYFQLMVTDVTNGLRVWQKESLIGKRGSNKSVAW